MENNPYQTPQPHSSGKHLADDRALHRLLDIVLGMQGMMWLFLFKVGMDMTVGTARVLFSDIWVTVYFCLYLVVQLAMSYFVFKVVHAIYDIGPAIICSLLVFAPCIGTLTVLVLNGNTMDHLRKQGIKVGFMGPTRQQIDDLRRQIAAREVGDP